ncbi:phosphoglycerate dehydrogenase [Propionibacterium freudenreichii]|nr:phosphoglycerate dehydrogenase [Propionibacterium freudenreichii]
MADHLTVAVATPLSEELCLLIEAREPRCELIRDQSLLPPMRYPGDHAGDPGFRRTARQEEAFRAMLTHADASYGIPGESPQLLAWTAEHNPGLRWVHTTAAGGGAQVRQAGLSREQLDRITFTTSAGVHAAPLAEFAVFGVLAGAKLLPRLTAQKHDRTWGGAFLMRQLSQMTVLVAGMGHIGNRCIDDFHALGARVIAYNRSVHDNPNVSAVYTTGQLGEAVEQADAIVVTLPGTERTNKLLSAEILQQVRPGTILVNVGRRTVIDQAAMVNALADGPARLRRARRGGRRAAAHRQPAVGIAECDHQSPHRRPGRPRGPLHRRTVRPQRHPHPRWPRAPQPGEHGRVLLSNALIPPATGRGDNG